MERHLVGRVAREQRTRAGNAAPVRNGCAGFPDPHEAAEARRFVWTAWVPSGSIFLLVKREGGTQFDPGIVHALGFEQAGIVPSRRWRRARAFGFLAKMPSKPGADVNSAVSCLFRFHASPRVI